MRKRCHHIDRQKNEAGDERGIFSLIAFQRFDSIHAKYKLGFFNINRFFHINRQKDEANSKIGTLH